MNFGVAGYRFIENMYEVNFGAYRPLYDPHFICSLNETFFYLRFLQRFILQITDAQRNVWLLLRLETECIFVFLVLNELLFIIP